MNRKATADKCKLNVHDAEGANEENTLRRRIGNCRRRPVEGTTGDELALGGTTSKSSEIILDSECADLYFTMELINQVVQCERCPIR